MSTLNITASSKRGFSGTFDNGLLSVAIDDEGKAVATNPVTNEEIPTENIKDVTATNFTPKFIAKAKKALNCR